MAEQTPTSIPSSPPPTQTAVFVDRDIIDGRMAQVYADVRKAESHFARLGAVSAGGEQLRAILKHHAVDVARCIAVGLLTRDDRILRYLVENNELRAQLATTRDGSLLLNVEGLTMIYADVDLLEWSEAAFEEFGFALPTSRESISAPGQLRNRYEEITATLSESDRQALERVERAFGDKEMWATHRRLDRRFDNQSPAEALKIINDELLAALRANPRAVIRAAHLDEIQSVSLLFLVPLDKEVSDRLTRPAERLMVDIIEAAAEGELSAERSSALHGLHGFQQVEVLPPFRSQIQ